MQCSNLGEDQTFTRSVPGIIQQLVTDLNCTVDGRRLSTEPWIVSTESDVDYLIDFLTLRNRVRDVVVFALPEGSDDPTQTIVPTEPIIRRTLGAAHIVVLTGPASYELSDLVGKEFSVFMQAVRRYRPGLNAETGQPFGPFRIAP